MIRLKQILLEASEEAESKKTYALFVGDQDTLASNSYARQLLKRKDISGKVAAKPDATLTMMYELVQNMLTKKYDVVSVFYDPNVQKEVADVEETILILENIFQYIKNHHDCTLVVIVPPLKHIDKDSKRAIADKEIRKWLLEQDVADYLIDIGKLERIEFSKDRNLVNINVQNIIKKQWLRVILGVSAESDDEVDTDDDDNKSTSLYNIGDTDIHIKYLQQHLLSLGYDVGTKLGNGVFDEQTKQAIIQFQRDHGIADTGEYNYQTRKLIQRELDMSTHDDEWRLKNILKPKKPREKVTGQIATAKDIIDFFTDKGLSTAGAAGIAGNLFVESGFKTYNLGDHGTSNGLAQWHNERWTGPNGFEQWCEQHGLDPWSVDGQLEFLWWELESKYAVLKTILENDDIQPEEAAQRFAELFERPQTISPARAQKARKFYDEYDSHPWIPGL